MVPASVLAAGDAAKGKILYEKSCAACHGPQGKGDGPTGKVLVPPAADFTSGKSRKQSEKELLAIIRDGKAGTAMVPWKGQLSDQAIQDVLAYVLTLRKP
jgi:mono/diheme cytochrome c family protein